MNFRSIMNYPRQITRRHMRIEKAMKARWSFERHALQHLLDADDPLAILIQSQRTRDARGSAIRAHNEAGPHAEGRGPLLEPDDAPRLHVCMLDTPRRRHPFHARAPAVVQKFLIQESHTPHAELVVRTDKIHGAASRRIKSHVTNRWAETIFRKSEVFQRAPHKYSGGVNGLFERTFPIDQENAPAALGE